MLEWVEIFEKYNFWMAIALMLIGLYGVITKENLVKKLIGLTIFQTAILLFFISLGDVEHGTAPIKKGVLPCETKIVEGYVYVNPLPQVLVLTAIVVLAATTAVALSLIIRIYEEYGAIEEEDILKKEREGEG
ncbi:MAG: cation:proton antiporter subunit C [Candidatus Methanospirareceae archaeon]